MFNSTIISAGMALPSQVVTTKSLLDEANTERYGIPSTMIEEDLGIIEVRHAGAETEFAQLAARAAEDAISQFSGSIDHIDALIYCGISADYVEPSTAHFVADILGIDPNMCFDVSNACHGIASGIVLGDSLIKTGACRYVLLVTAELGSRVTRGVIQQFKARKLRFKAQNLMGGFSVGDAGGATIMGVAEGLKGVQFISSRTQSKYNKLCYYSHADGGGINGEMDMPKICVTTLKLLRDLTSGTYSLDSWSPENIDELVLHQVGWKIYDRMLAVLLLPPEKSIKTFPWLGNIASATIPVNLNQMFNQGRIKEGDRVLLQTTGSGITASHIGIAY